MVVVQCLQFQYLLHHTCHILSNSTTPHLPHPIKPYHTTPYLFASKHAVEEEIGGEELVRPLEELLSHPRQRTHLPQAVPGVLAQARVLLDAVEVAVVVKWRWWFEVVMIVVCSSQMVCLWWKVCKSREGRNETV